MVKGSRAARAATATIGVPAMLAAAALAADFQVNTYTASSQLEAVVGRAASGAFVVAWQSANQDGQFYGIFAQRFDSAGAEIGVELQVNTYTTGTQSHPALAMNDGGAFVIVWRSGSSQDGSGYGVFGQRFASSGARQGTEFRANEQTAFDQGSPAVAVDDQGDFVVAWEGSEYGGASGIFGRRFGSNGAALAGDFRVNLYTLYTQRYPAIASDADGDFVVSWDSRNQEGAAGSYGVFARRFGSAGTATGTEFQVSTHTISEQFLTTVAADDGGAFVIAWQSYHDGSGAGIFGRRFSAAGAPLAVEFQVNQRTTLQQIRASIDVAPGGAFLVAWTDSARDGSFYGAFGRRFDSSGAATSADFQVNSYTFDEQRLPSVALGDDGGFIAAWQGSQRDGFGFGIFAAVTPPPAALDVDGDGSVLPLTDGLLVLRDHFGFTGTTLATGATGASCSRCTGPAITSYLTALGMQLDIDGNGALEPLTDGLLVLRYLFGFTGTTLTNNAVGQPCSRCDAALIVPYLDDLKTLPPD